MTPQDHVMALSARLEAIEDREAERHNAFRRAARAVRALVTPAMLAAHNGDGAAEIALLAVAVDALARGEG